MTENRTRPGIAFNSARFLTSATRLDQCPPDEGAEVAFTGRSNSGKSSALNAITRNSKLARTSKTPGRTRLINFFSLSEPGARLVDLPGYGFARVSRETQQAWQKHLAHYLEQRESLKGMTLIMDSRRPLSEFDWMLIEWCQHHELPMLLLLTKIDKLNRNMARQQLREVQTAVRELPCITGVEPFSALKGNGVEETRRYLETWLTGPHSD